MNLCKISSKTLFFRYQIGSNNNHRRRSRSRSPVRRSPSRHEEYLVKIRGMPYTVVEEDIRKVESILKL